LPIIPIQGPALPTPHSNLFTVVSGQVSFSNQVPFNSVTVLVGGHLYGWFQLTGLPWNFPVVPQVFLWGGHQPLIVPVPKLIDW